MRPLQSQLHLLVVGNAKICMHFGSVEARKKVEEITNLYNRMDICLARGDVSQGQITNIFKISEEKFEKWLGHIWGTLWLNCL